MQEKLAATLIKIANMYDIEARLYENYSGRGMYGKLTTGIVVSSLSDVMSILYSGATIIAEAVEAGELDDYVDEFRSDALGRDVIVY